MSTLFDPTPFGNSSRDAPPRPRTPPPIGPVVTGPAWVGVAVGDPGTFHRIKAIVTFGAVAVCGRAVGVSTIDPKIPRPGCAKCSLDPKRER